LETEAADKQLFKRVPGFQYLALTEPAVKKSFHRVGWAQYADGVDVKDVVTKLDNSKVRREGTACQARRVSYCKDLCAPFSRSPCLAYFPLYFDQAL